MVVGLLSDGFKRNLSCSVVIFKRKIDGSMMSDCQLSVKCWFLNFYASCCKIWDDWKSWQRNKPSFFEERKVLQSSDISDKTVNFQIETVFVISRLFRKFIRDVTIGMWNIIVANIERPYWDSNMIFSSFHKRLYQWPYLRTVENWRSYSGIYISTVTLKFLNVAVEKNNHSFSSVFKNSLSSSKKF